MSRLPGWVVFALGVAAVVLAGAVLSGFFAPRQATAQSEAAIAWTDLAEARQEVTLLVQALAGQNAGATGQAIAAYNAVCNDWLEQARLGADSSTASTPCARALARLRSLDSGSVQPSVEP